MQLGCDVKQKLKIFSPLFGSVMICSKRKSVEQTQFRICFNVLSSENESDESEQYDISDEDYCILCDVYSFISVYQCCWSKLPENIAIMQLSPCS